MKKIKLLYIVLLCFILLQYLIMVVHADTDVSKDRNVASDETEENVVKNQDSATIEVQDTKIYMNTSSFDYTSMIKSAVSSDGLPISVSDISISGTDDINLNQFGIHQIAFSYQGSKPVYANLIVSEGAQIQTTQSNFTGYEGIAIKPNQLVLISKIITGTTIDYRDVHFSGTSLEGETLNLNSPGVGVYTVIATYEDANVSFQVTIKDANEDQSTLKLVSDEWTIDLMYGDEIQAFLDNPYTQIAEMKDAYGNSMPPSRSNVTVTTKFGRYGSVGDYTMTFKGTNGRSATLNIHAVSSRLTINTQDQTIKLGETFNPLSSLVKVTSVFGGSISLTDRGIKTSSNVNPRQIGEYTVTYTYRGVSESAKINVVKNDSDKMFIFNDSKKTIYQNDAWLPQNLLSGVIYNGELLEDNSEVKIEYETSKVSQLGTFDVTLTYKDLTETVTVTVLEDKSSLLITNRTLHVYVGSTINVYSLADILATDANGTTSYNGLTLLAQNKAIFSVVTIEGNIKASASSTQLTPTASGTLRYTVNFRGHSETFDVVAENPKTTVSVKNAILFIGQDTWKPADNFISATSYSGGNLDFSDVTIDGSVPVDADNKVTQIGEYVVHYSVPGENPNNVALRVTETATVRVVTATQDINMRDVNIYVGTSWSPADNFVSGLSETGKPLTSDDIGGVITYKIIDSSSRKIVNDIDTTKAGIYQIVYSYGDLTRTATVRVIAVEPTIVVRDITIFQGSDWTNADNFVRGNNAAGVRLTLDQLTVSDGKVDTSQPGTYTVSYSYADFSVDAKVTVVKRQLAINAFDSDIPIGSSWSVADNFISASLSSGENVSFEAIDKVDIKDANGTIVTAIDTSKVGIYSVTYYLSEEENGQLLITETTVQVSVISLAELQVIDLTIPISSEWNPAHTFLSATSPSGQILAWNQVKDDIEITGTVDTTVAGSYHLVYKYMGIEKSVTVIVVGERSLAVPITIDFGKYTLGTSGRFLLFPEENLIVNDSVENSTGWLLTAQLENNQSDFANYLMNGSSRLVDNSSIAQSSIGGKEIVNANWGEKKGLWVDYSDVTLIRNDAENVIWTLTPNIKNEVSE